MVDDGGMTDQDNGAAARQLDCFSAKLHKNELNRKLSSIQRKLSRNRMSVDSFSKWRGQGPQIADGSVTVTGPLFAPSESQLGPVN